MAKRFFAQQNITYEERDVIANEAYMQELKDVAGRFITPTLVIDGEVLIGFGNNLERIRTLCCSNAAIWPLGIKSSHVSIVGEIRHIE